MIFVAPYYVSKRYLPNASDVFFHRQLVYFPPTGFTPTETESIFNFPEYCHKKRIALPQIFWNFCSRYFINSQLAMEAIDILTPLIDSKNIVMTALIYPRDIRAIEKAIQVMQEHPKLKKKILHSPLDMDCISREVCSHLLYEVFLEKRGYEGVVQYLDRYKSKEQILTLISAIVVNRLRVLASLHPLLVFDEFWIDILKETPPPEENQKREFEIDAVDFFCSTLLGSILFPLYGRCDSLKKEPNHRTVKYGKTRRN
jgi:hypothetical protein